MKKIPTIREVLENIFGQMTKNYDGSKISGKKEILFDLNHEGDNLLYTLVATPEQLDLVKGKVEDPALSVTCSAFDWIDIAGGNKNPILAAITGKVKFKGDSKILSDITPDNLDDAWQKINDAPGDYEQPRKRSWTKPEKVLVISGSPRGGRGYTQILLSSVIDGMESQDVEVETVVLSKKNIRACTGCWSCWMRTEGECVFKDDMVDLAVKLQEADIIVYAFPVYVDGVPGIVKNFLDRQTQNMYPYMTPGLTRTRHPRRVSKEQYYVVFSTCGFPEIETFDPIISHFDAIAHQYHVPVISYLLTPQGPNLFKNPLYYPQLVEKVDALKEAGEQIVLNGKVDKKVLKKISSTTAKNKITFWQKEASQFWQERVDSKSKDY